MTLEAAPGTGSRSTAIPWPAWAAEEAVACMLRQGTRPGSIVPPKVQNLASPSLRPSVLILPPHPVSSTATPSPFNSPLCQHALSSLRPPGPRQFGRRLGRARPPQRQRPPPLCSQRRAGRHRQLLHQRCIECAGCRACCCQSSPLGYQAGSGECLELLAGDPGNVLIHFYDQFFFQNLDGDDSYYIGILGTSLFVVPNGNPTAAVGPGLFSCEVFARKLKPRISHHRARGW